MKDVYLKKKDEILTFAHRWCDLNCWIWPDEIDGKPEGYDEMPDSQKYVFNHPKMIDIENHIKELTRTNPDIVISWYWNCIYANDLTTEEWFENYFFGSIAEFRKMFGQWM